MGFGIGPCMCGGCKRCLHDQGLHCGDVTCCGPTEPLVVKVRFDAADYSTDGQYGGYTGHSDRLMVIFLERRADGRLVETVREGFEYPHPDYATTEEEREVVEEALEWLAEEHEAYFQPPSATGSDADYDFEADDRAYDESQG